MKVFNDVSTLKGHMKWNDFYGDQLRVNTMEFEFTNFLYGFLMTRPSPGNNQIALILFFTGDSNVASPITGITRYNYATGNTETYNKAFDIRTNWLFTNSFQSGRINVSRYPNDWITKANSTMNTLISYHGNIKYVYISFTVGDSQPDFELVTESGSFVFCDATYWDSTSTRYEGYVYNKYVGGEYNNADVWSMWTSNPDSTTGYGFYLGMYPFVLANGNRDYDLDYDNPFIPAPTTFYLTVNANTDAEANGEQKLRFTWEPNNSEETNLFNVILHFRFYRGGNTYDVDVPYTDDSLTISYVDILKGLNISWWVNIVKHIPVIGSDLVDGDIGCLIWWSKLDDTAGMCEYLVRYNGSNQVVTEKQKNPSSNLWTYLTATVGEDDIQDYDDPYNPYDDMYEFGGGTDAVNGSALLTTSYSLSVANAHSFGNWLWSQGFDLSQLKMVVNNPIENIVSCKLFPFSVSGTAATVKLGNVASTVPGNKLAENVARTFDFGVCQFPKLFGADLAFLNYPPYTIAKIYLPYIGFREIDSTFFTNSTVALKYYVDLVTGSCRAILTSYYFDSVGNTKQKEVMTFDGMIGQDVPVVSSNRAQVEAGYIVGGMQSALQLASGVGNLVAGNIGGGISGIASSITNGINTAMTPYHTYNNGTPAPALSRFDEQRAFIIVESPVYTMPKKFAHQNGRVCNITARLGELKGYTVVDNTVDLSTIACNVEEREQLMRLLTTGIYI